MPEILVEWGRDVPMDEIRRRIRQMKRETERRHAERDRNRIMRIMQHPRGRRSWKSD